MKLSIIVPVYRVEAVLDRCVGSIIGQNLTDYEVILVDDGSPDRCPQLCDEWAGRDSHIRVIHKQNGGLSDARNAGLDVAEGELVTFVDSDDFLAPDTYSQVLPLSADADIVEFPLYRFYGSQRQEVISFPDKQYSDMKEYWLQGHAYEHCYAWNKIYRRHLFNDVQFPVGKVFEDTATLPRLLKNANTVATTSRGMYHYCANDAGITATAKGDELQMLLEAHLSVLPQWCDDRYYMNILNIQIDVAMQTDRKPELPPRRVSPLAGGLNIQMRIKAVLLNLLGTERLCKLFKAIRHR